MSLLSTTNRVAALKAKGTKAISVFQKTVSDLSSVNDEIEKEQKIRDAKVIALNGEIEELEIAKNQNESFINKLNDFLGLE